MRRTIGQLVSAAAALFLGALAPAGPTTMTFGNANSVAPAPVHMWIFPESTPIDISIPTNAPASMKRDLIRNSLASHGYCVADSGPSGLTMGTSGPGIPCDTPFSVGLNTGGTGEVGDMIAAPRCASARIEYTPNPLPSFAPFDTHNQPAIFTAGIVTDVGVLSAQISAQELNFQTDGPIICQALFQRLAPRAPQYGAQINYAGDRLEVYFDPAYTVTQGGIIFGTTSPSQAGCTGTIVVPAAPPCPADRNGDGAITPVDIALFINDWLTSLQNGTLLGDFNGDGVVTPADVGAFVNAWFQALIFGC